MPTQGNINLK